MCRPRILHCTNYVLFVERPLPLHTNTGSRFQVHDHTKLNCSYNHNDSTREFHTLLSRPSRPGIFSQNLSQLCSLQFLNHPEGEMVTIFCPGERTAKVPAFASSSDSTLQCKKIIIFRDVTPCIFVRYLQKFWRNLLSLSSGRKVSWTWKRQEAEL
jgi:hypothetical protein